MRAGTEQGGGAFARRRKQEKDKAPLNLKDYVKELKKKPEAPQLCQAGKYGP